jgi:phospholipid/cholesterol/gamma-HCH transport system substrate-binding protein
MSASRQVALGVFVLGGLLLFGIGLFWIGDRRQFFDERLELYAEFSNLSGLSKGAKVRVAGLDAGEVLDIQIPPDPDAPFRVHFRTLSNFQSILRMDSVASILNDGLVGNKFLQVGPGTSAAAPVTSGATIRSREPIEIADIMFQVQETVKTANSAITDIRGGIDSTVKTIVNLTAQTTEIVSDVADQMNKFAVKGNAITDDVGAIVAKARRGEGSVGRFLNDDALYEQMRSAVRDGESVARNFKAVSDDLKTISDDLKSRDLGAKVESVAGKVDQVAANVETLTKEAISAVRSFQGPEGASGGLMAEVRQTLSSTNETMANFADSSEALKRNFLFSGFFKDRGYFDLDAVTVREYREGNFLPDRQKVTEWLDAGALFGAAPSGQEQITAEGRRRLDFAMAGFLRYSKNEPFVIESWAGPGTEPEKVLRSRERAIMVSEYLVQKFDLKPNYVAIMPMNAIPSTDGRSRDGVELVLYAPKPSRK